MTLRRPQSVRGLCGVIVLCGGVTLVACDGGAANAPGAMATKAVDAQPDGGGPPTWHRDVAPLLARHCVSCHGGGGVGPFALNTYDDARPRHLAIASVTAAGTMPPWLPADGCHDLRAPRRLSASEIETLRDWSRADGPLGDPSTAAEQATLPPAQRLAWVDRTLDIGADFVPRPATGSIDVERCFLLDPSLEDDAFLVGYELRPSDRTQLFRAVLVESPLAEARADDAGDPEPGWACPSGLGTGTSRVVGTWTTTNDAVTYPERSGIRLHEGYGIVLALTYHLHSSGVPDRPELALQLARGPIDKEVEVLLVAPSPVSIPPRTKGYTLAASLELPHGAAIWAVEARMHRLGRSVHAEARGADGSTCLLDIPRYDYHWEEMHYFDRQAVAVTSGGRIDVRCVWDNPTDAPISQSRDLTGEACEVAMIVTRP